MTYNYDSRFMDYTAGSSRYSAHTIVAKIRQALPVASLLDIGCARGTWLDEWQKAGTADVFGVDGNYIKPDQLVIPAERFRAADLSQPIELERTFDLVQSLEVAEHVAATSANTFVQNLVRHASGAILFSAAPPGQGGEFHVNEQPYDYWREKFRQHGYEAYDWVRPQIASDKAISFWYRFNVILYLTAERAAGVTQDISSTKVSVTVPLADISPLWFKARKAAVRLLPFSMQQALARAKARLTQTV